MSSDWEMSVRFIKYVMAFGMIASGAMSGSGANAAPQPVERHGVSLFGEPKYGPDFTHFDYVNPDAPQGGVLRQGAIGTFDSLNPFIIKGSPAGGVTFIYEQLMTDSYDEASTAYGLIAKSVSYPDDFSSVTFTLRPQAHFHDGVPITAHDVVWSFETITANHPGYAAYYANVSKVEALDDHRVQFSFDAKGNRELPVIVGQLWVLPKHYWADKDFTKTTLVPPLGSGPYRISDVKPGQSLAFEKVEDYWGKDLNVNVGANNFAGIRYEYFQDSGVALEAFKAGRLDVRRENSSKNWATGYSSPALADGRIIKEMIEVEQGVGMQGFVLNLRREKFQDPRVREALTYAFDYEWTNKTLFYGQYTRTDSYYDNSELASTGLPEGLELEILTPFKDQLPPQVFTDVFKLPTSDGSGRNRRNISKATALLKEAGYEIVNGKLVHGVTKQPLQMEFVINQPTFERVVLPYVKTLKDKLGIEASLRFLDTSQYQNRLDSFDYDVAITTFGQSLSPGNEQRDFWGCAAKDKEGGRNLAGICDPVIEKLIDRVIFAKDRQELVAATKALDRVLLWNHFVVPQWHIAAERIARWSGFKHPEPTPAFSPGLPVIWWYEAAGE